MLNPLKILSPYTSGADLRYTDDSIESYPDIFENCTTDADEEAMKRVIAALKSLSEKDIENAVDAEEVIRYFVVHNFTSNYDSYTGLLDHNYYLCEKDGQLSMLPWDYNYFDCLCTLERSTTLPETLGENYIDADIYHPLLVEEDSRPMWSWIVSDDQYLEQYNSEMDRFLTECIESGWAEDEITRIGEMIRDEVKSDPNALCTIEAYDVAVEDILAFMKQRAECIRNQMN